ncbi:uncharacterized protein LOC141686789 [Apium graveolens]|uniref:uncharacterized protein LOC141686789 n=1 Tax=Apium graveolens TaxID=4045 RepID=UPI003D7B4BD4
MLGTGYGMVKGCLQSKVVIGDYEERFVVKNMGFGRSYGNCSCRVDVSALCTWCHSHVEEATHTLFICSFAQELWSEVGLQELSNIEAGMMVKDILKREFNNSTRESVKSKTTTVLQEWQQSQERVGKGIEGAQKLNRQWYKPPEGWIKIILDAACSSQMGEIGVACVVRNDRGDFLQAMSKRFSGSTRAREAEALCLREMLVWIKRWRNQRCIFELDSKLVVDVFHGEMGNSVFHTIIDDCVSLLKHFSEVLVVFEYRSANIVAHLLARAAFSMSSLMEWYHAAPEIMLCNLISDAN